MKAAVSKVTITSDVFNTCTSHAHTTEHEEVMGLLLGDTKQVGDELHTNIWGVSLLTRSDRRQDRVEISPEQLFSCAQEGEKMSAETGTKTRVIGWYHSHPHMTVLPSHVDLNTQWQYQLMEAGFVGLIFSVFNESRNSGGRVQLIAFQTVRGSDMEVDRGQVQGGDQRAEIPLHVVPTPSYGQHSPDKVVELQRILFKEERQAYLDAVKPHMRDGKAVAHPLFVSHSAAVYQKSLCKLLEYSCIPLVQALDDRHNQNLCLLQRLKEEEEELLGRIRETQEDDTMDCSPAV